MRYLLIIISFSFTVGLSGQDIRFMTYNIRVDFPGDSLNSWKDRRSMIAELIRKYQPGIMGFQEGLPHQVAWLDSVLTGYDYTGQGRDGGNEGEASPVFYDKSRFKLITDSTLWLSPTPGIPSKGWDAALNRVVTWCLLQDLVTKNKLIVINTHFDHIGEEARKQSASMILELTYALEEQFECYAVFLGDLNSEPGSEPVLTLMSLLSDSRDVAGTVEDGPDYTFNGFDPGISPKRRIDYIMTELPVKYYAIIGDMRGNKYPSDHFPVICDIRF